MAWRASRNETRFSIDSTECRYSSSLWRSARPRSRRRALASSSTRSITARSGDSGFADAWICSARAWPRRRPVGDDGRSAPEHPLEDEPGVGLVGDVGVGRAERVLVVVQPEFERGEIGLVGGRPGGGLVDRDAGVDLAVDLLHHLGTRQVQEGAMLVGVEALGVARVRQAGEDEQVILERFERPEDRGQLAQRPLVLRLPRLQDRAAGDAEDPQAERRLAGGRGDRRSGAIASRYGRARKAPAPRRTARRDRGTPVLMFMATLRVSLRGLPGSDGTETARSGRPRAPGPRTGARRVRGRP